MALLIIFTLLGAAFGQATFPGGGGLIGGALGFLITKIFQLSSKVESLQQHVDALRAQSHLQAVINRPAQPVSAPVAANAQAALEPKTQAAAEPNAQVAEPPKAQLSEPPKTMAERLGVQKNTVPSEPTTATIAAHQAAAMATAPIAATPKSPPPARPAQPQLPNPIEKALDYLNNFFNQGNPIVRIGMVVMFFGLSFLVKYAANQGLFPIELRLAAVAGVAVALIGLGWKTRHKQGGFGLVLQGGGVAALYLTVFAAAKMYALMPPGAAFALMFIIVMFGAALAVLQNAQVLALMATAGGFLAPILTSDGSGNHVGLFGYYLLLNIGILVIAWFKTWRLLNWVGFVFTFIITSFWGVLKYEPQFYASTQPFLLAFFALYLAVSILFSLKQPPNLKGLVDGSLIFGLPIVAFGLQATLLKHTQYGVAISAFALAAIYTLLARLLWAKYATTHRLLIESFIALAVCFATLTIPLALDAQWTSATWALEAAGLIWVGLRQARLLPRVAGYLLHGAAALSLVISGINTGDIPLLSGDFIGLVILAVSALCIAYLLMRLSDCCCSQEQSWAQLPWMMGWFWWLLAGYMEIKAHIPAAQLFASLLVFFAASVAGFMALGAKLQWPQLARVGYSLLPLAALLAMGFFGKLAFQGLEIYPSQGWGGLALLVFVVVQYRFLWGQREASADALLSFFHVFSAWFLFALGYWEARHWQTLMQWQGTAAVLLWFCCLMLPLVALIKFANKPIWPFTQYPVDYQTIIPAPLFFAVTLWFISACGYSGSTHYPYLPILNPLDMAQAAVLMIVVFAIKRGFLQLDTAPAELRYGIIGLFGFIWINVVLLRAIHHLAGIDYSFVVMWNSVAVQMALSILWSISALIIMNASRRWQERRLWMIGAGLLALVLIKLFTKDLTGTGTLARIVSFMVVGGLMLAIGYLSPIPTQRKSSQQQE
jgi:uncharacterized membrane protein